MKRLLVLFIAVLLPLQLVWGTAAAYCGHEATAALQQSHPGHHAHEHDGASAQPLVDDGGTLAGDLDCQACHAATAAALPAFMPPLVLTLAVTAAPAPADSRRPSAPQRAPDRPQWPRLA